MKNHYIIRLLLSFIFMSVGLTGVCLQTVAASCIVDPSGTYIEAENYTGSEDLASNPDNRHRFTAIVDADAKGGEALKAGSKGRASGEPQNEVKEYNVCFSEAGTYYMWMRGLGYGGDQNSVFFTVDDDAWKAFTFNRPYNNFKWTKSMQVGSSNTINIATPGHHTIKIAMREKNTVIDGFYITKEAAVIPDDNIVTSENEAVPSVACSCRAIWTIDNPNIHAYSYETYNTRPIDFVVTNSGENDASASVTVTSNVSWIVLPDPIPPLAVGDAHTVSVELDTQNLSVGNHTGTLTFTSAGNSVINSPLTITISLTVRAVPTSSGCGEIPLYAENIVSPAIMVQLDTSGSMRSMMPVGGGRKKQRITIAEEVLAQLFQDRTIEWGFANWSGRHGWPTYTNYLIGCHTHDDEHHAALQDKADDGNAGGSTPLVPCMRAGLKYFQSVQEDDYKDNYYKEYFNQVTCQPRILIIITDGWGNTGTSIPKIERVMDDLIAEGVTVVAVGFGLNNTSQLDKIVEKMKAAGEQSDDDYLYHLHPENENGKAVPFMAQNEAEFIAAMQNIVTRVKAQMFHGSSPAFSASATNDAILLSASFDPKDNWSGDLSAIEFDTFTGKRKTEYLWHAADEMPDVINGFIAVSDTETTVSQYTKASIEGDNFLCKKLGDIINSAPAIASRIPPYYYKFDNYFADFKYNSDIYDRDAMVYVGANDGALHAFQLKDGVEKWRFYPDAVKSKLANAEYDPGQNMCSSSYCHQFILDGSPKLADIYVDSSMGWRTILTTGLGKGGNAFFSLDVTHGEDFDAANEVKSKLLWEFKDNELGLATSDPVTARVSNSTTATEWVTFFGSGELEKTAEQANKEAYLFAVKSYDGSNAWVDSDGKGVNKVKLSSTPLIDDKTSSPLVVETHNDDYIFDKIYIGNLYGNLYRVSQIGVGEVPNSEVFFDAENTDRSAPVSATPADAYASDGNLWVYFGTGRYSKSVDKTSSSQQYFYGLYDKNASMTEYKKNHLAWRKADIVEAYALDADGNKVDFDGDGTPDKYRYRTISCLSSIIDGVCKLSESDKHDDLKSLDINPWGIKLYTSASGGPSERIITQPLITSGIVFIVTFVPDGNVCEGGGESWILAVDWETGEVMSDPVFDINGDGSIDDADKTVEDENGVKHEVVGFYLGRGRPSANIAIYGNNLAVGGTGGLLSGDAPRPNRDGLIRVNLPAQDTKLKSWQQDLK